MWELCGGRDLVHVGVPQRPSPNSARTLALDKKEGGSAQSYHEHPRTLHSLDGLSWLRGVQWCPPELLMLGNSRQLGGRGVHHPL